MCTAPPSKARWRCGPTCGAAVFAAAESDYNATIATPFNELVQSHTAAWAELWRSGIELVAEAETTDASLPRRVNSSLYYLYSGSREDVAMAPAPGLLGTNFDGYFGNAFWVSPVSQAR